MLPAQDGDLALLVPRRDGCKAREDGLTFIYGTLSDVTNFIFLVSLLAIFELESLSVDLFEPNSFSIECFLRELISSFVESFSLSNFLSYL